MIEEETEEPNVSQSSGYVPPVLSQLSIESEELTDELKERLGENLFKHYVSNLFQIELKFITELSKAARARETERAVGKKTADEMVGAYTTKWLQHTKSEASKSRAGIPAQTRLSGFGIVPESSTWTLKKGKSVVLESAEENPTEESPVVFAREDTEDIDESILSGISYPDELEDAEPSGIDIHIRRVVLVKNVPRFRPKLPTTTAQVTRRVVVHSMTPTPEGSIASIPPDELPPTSPEDVKGGAEEENCECDDDKDKNKEILAYTVLDPQTPPQQGSMTDKLSISSSGIAITPRQVPESDTPTSSEEESSLSWDLSSFNSDTIEGILCGHVESSRLKKNDDIIKIINAQVLDNLVKNVRLKIEALNYRRPHHEKYKEIPKLYMKTNKGESQYSDESDDTCDCEDIEDTPQTHPELTEFISRNREDSDTSEDEGISDDESLPESKALGGGIKTDYFTRASSGTGAESTTKKDGDGTKQTGAESSSSEGTSSSTDVCPCEDEEETKKIQARSTKGHIRAHSAKARTKTHTVTHTESNEIPVESLKSAIPDLVKEILRKVGDLLPATALKTLPVDEIVKKITDQLPNIPDAEKKAFLCCKKKKKAELTSDDIAWALSGLQQEAIIKIEDLTKSIQDELVKLLEQKLLDGSLKRVDFSKTVKSEQVSPGTPDSLSESFSETLSVTLPKTSHERLDSCSCDDGSVSISLGALIRSTIASASASEAGVISSYEGRKIFPAVPSDLPSSTLGSEVGGPCPCVDDGGLNLKAVPAISSTCSTIPSTSKHSSTYSATRSRGSSVEGHTCPCDSELKLVPAISSSSTIPSAYSPEAASPCSCESDEPETTKHMQLPTVPSSQSSTPSASSREAGDPCPCDLNAIEPKAVSVVISTPSTISSACIPEAASPCSCEGDSGSETTGHKPAPDVPSVSIASTLSTTPSTSSPEAGDIYCPCELKPPEYKAVPAIASTHSAIHSTCNPAPVVVPSVSFPSTVTTSTTASTGSSSEVGEPCVCENVSETKLTEHKQVPGIPSIRSTTHSPCASIPNIMSSTKVEFVIAPKKMESESETSSEGDFETESDEKSDGNSVDLDDFIEDIMDTKASSGESVKSS